MVGARVDRRSRRHLVIVAIALLAVGGVAGPPVAAADEPTLFAPPTDTADRATVTIHLASNGSATVTVAYARQLPNETAIDRFRRSSTPLFDQTERLATRTLDRIENLTGRSTNATVIDRDSRITTGSDLRTEGVRSIQFRVRGLTTTADTGVTADIPMQIALDEEHRLVVETASGLAIENATPEPASATNTTAEYVGPRTLDGLTVQTRRTATADTPGVGAWVGLAIAGLFALLGALGAGWWVRQSEAPADSEPDHSAETTDPGVLPDDRRVTHLLDDADG
ncbi:MAG: hypothetical protein ACOCYZ_02400, partial [Halococcoides sp.]